MCSPCGKHFPIGEFHWKDTGESIVAYYSRCRERIPMPTKVISARTTGMVFTLCGAGLGVALGVLAGQWLGILAGIAAGIVGVLVGALGGLVVWGTLHEIAIRSALNVPDVRCLK
jgi:hypothetical protein